VKPSEAEPGKMTRRQLLRLVALSAVGAGIVVGARSMVGAAFPAQAKAVASTTTSSSSSSASSTSAVSTSSSTSLQEIKVKVAYFQMPLVVNTSVEYYHLQTPIHYSDLLPQILQAHPDLQPMMPTMMVMIDGVVAQPGTPLQDGDEVDFIPVMAGG
jgi:hypothetical protein